MSLYRTPNENKRDRDLQAGRITEEEWLRMENAQHRRELLVERYDDGGDDR